VIPRIDVTGVRLWVPRGPNGELKKPAVAQRKSGPASMVGGEVHLERLSVQLQAKVAGEPATEFLLRQAVLRNVGPQREASYAATLHYPKPPGEVQVQGRLGPVPEDARLTPVVGSFTFWNADLTTKNGVTGLLSASGKFRGPVSRMEFSGTADVPRFQVLGSSHTAHLAAQFEVKVNGVTGDAELTRIVTHFNDTTVLAAGSVAADPEKDGKRLTLSASVEQGRVDDLLLLFTARPVPAMRGAIRLQGRFVVPPGPGFLRKLQVDGDFSIHGGRFTNPKTQTPIDRLSASAEGVEKGEQRAHPKAASADIRGQVRARGGVAQLEKVEMEAPGIAGSAAGTFGLVDRRIAMRGAIRTGGKLGDTSSGLKTVVLKGMQALMRRRDGEKVIPFRIAGKSSRPELRMGIR
jgi:hypothetical protein